MSLTSIFCKAVYGSANAVANGIVNSCDFMSGSSALRKKHLSRPDDGDDVAGWGILGGIFGGFAAFVLAGPVICPLAALELFFLPAQLQTAYLVGKQTNQRYQQEAKRCG